MNNHERLWTANENLLQSYRQIFIVSQSVMLMVGAILLRESRMLLIGSGLISLYVIWGLWVPIVLSRHKLIDYHKHALRLSETERGALCSESDYVGNRAEREKANALLNIDGNLGVTRIKLDLAVPACITAIWLLYFAYVGSG